jgi:hypothetical protein
MHQILLLQCCRCKTRRGEDLMSYEKYLEMYRLKVVLRYTGLILFTHFVSTIVHIAMSKCCGVNNLSGSAICLKMTKSALLLKPLFNSEPPLLIFNPKK